MEEELKLPELPKARRIDEIAYDNDFAFTASDLVLFGAECARMERERCARIVDDYEFPGIVPHNEEDREVAECAGEVLRFRLFGPLAAAIRKG